MTTISAASQNSYNITISQRSVRIIWKLELTGKIMLYVIFHTSKHPKHTFIYLYIYICICILRHVLRPAQYSSVWLGLPSREQLMSPECSKHQVLSLTKMLVVNKQKYSIYKKYISICFLFLYDPGRENKWLLDH